MRNLFGRVELIEEAIRNGVSVMAAWLLWWVKQLAKPES